MYNYSIKTTYLDLKDEKQDTQFRKELLDVFDVPEYSHKTFMTTIDSLYNKYKNNKQMINILKVAMNNCDFPIELDQATAFTTMFSFHNFYLFHNALCDLERNSKINDELYNKIIKNLQKK